MSTTPRPGARLSVIVPPELASGFRLAGAEVEEASDTDDAAAVLETVLAEGTAGIVGVYAPFHASLPTDLAERCDHLIDPIVIPLPAGLGTDDAAGHRARIAALLERAVGYHIAFSDEVAS